MAILVLINPVRPLQAQDHLLRQDFAPFGVAEHGTSLRYPFLGGFDSPRPQFADIDDDGDPDLFVQEHTGSMMFFRNEGVPTQPDYVLETDRYEGLDIGQWAVLADLDGDLDLDVLAERPFGLIRIYRNDGDRFKPSFQLAVDTLRSVAGELISADATIPVVADVDCNGRIDLMLGRDAGTISRYEWVSNDEQGNPVFTFVENRYQDIEVIGGIGKWGTANLHGASSVSFVDLDTDGDLDLLWGDFFEPNLILFRNEGTCSSPAFNRETDSAMTSDGEPLNTSGFNAPRVADVDADGMLDLFVGVQGGAFVSSSSSVQNFYRFEEAGGLFDLVASRFIPVIDVGSDASPLIVDVTGEGEPDLLVGNLISPGDPTRATVSFFADAGSGLDLVETDAVPFQGFSATPSATDVDCDLDPDLFVGSFDGRIASFVAARSDGAVSWTVGESSFAGIDVGANSAPTWADIDGDGDEDLFVGEAGGGIWFFRNVGSSCAPELILESESYAGIDVGRMSRPTFSDYDSDGDLDLFVGGDVGVVRFFRNEGTASDAQLVEGDPITVAGPGLVTPALGDFDDDGDPDLIVGIPTGGLLYYRNDRVVTGFQGGARPMVGQLSAEHAYPNPATSEVNLTVNLAEPVPLVVEAVDILGRVVLTRELGFLSSGSITVRLDIGALAPGAYTLRLRGQQISVSRVVVVVR